MDIRVSIHETFSFQHFPMSVGFVTFLKSKFNYLIRQISCNERSVSICLRHKPSTVGWNKVVASVFYLLAMKQVWTRLICTCNSTFAFSFDIFSQREDEVSQMITSLIQLCWVIYWKRLDDVEWVWVFFGTALLDTQGAEYGMHTRQFQLRFSTHSFCVTCCKQRWHLGITSPSSVCLSIRPSVRLSVCPYITSHFFCHVTLFLSRHTFSVQLQ